MTIAIRVEGVSKRYVLQHQQRERYTTFRDSFASAARRLGKRAIGKATHDSVTEEEFWALRDMDFKIDQGERVGIIGRNGAGKSTLLKILSHITEPTEGRITITGKVASLLEVGTGFHPELTGRENIFLNGAILGMARAEIQRKFDEIVDFAGVERFLDTPVKRYSSGMYVRLAFAVGANLDPEILIVDEVLAVGDAEFQRKCMGKMEEVGSSGRTVLFVSHNLPTVLRLCPRTLLLEGGRLIGSGESSRIIQTYLAAKALGTADRHGLSDVRRIGGMGERFRFTGCSVLNAQGMATNRLLFGEPISIRLDTVANEDIDEVSVAVGFDNYAEVRVATVLSEESGVLYDYSAKQTREITTRPQHFVLKPGRYFVTLGARRQGQPLDQLSQALSFDVDSVPWQEVQPPSETSGIVQVFAEWVGTDG
jgi:lipopolysaccharide transport system ATP-binding protein